MNGLEGDVVDLDGRKILAMPIQRLVTFSSFLLENKYFVAFEMFEDGGGDFCTCNGGGTHFNGTVVVN